MSVESNRTAARSGDIVVQWEHEQLNEADEPTEIHEIAGTIGVIAGEQFSAEPLPKNPNKTTRITAITFDMYRIITINTIASIELFKAFI